MMATSTRLVILSGLPVTTEDVKLRLISGFLIGKLRSKRTLEMQERVYMPVGGQHLTLGFAIVKFESDQQAEDAIRTLNGTAIDRNHTFVVERLLGSTVWTDAVAAGLVGPNVLEGLKEIEVQDEDEE